ncbi:hypothetical protein [Myroides marinus]|uniref:hypothetical protein n=1 Tax=Myroides marinus TaxID=703342 RepID=UPI002576D1D8|nr:hypothetical protein [Myroides marinus]MDM1370179.1 hypothetical protein [Myroides marinus]MDM1373684.1 hypothetical protein [Myroides marinus]MDM1377165.1 hypothetical protein [Myroides marinus]MDM1384465.1 hypothetical protein [Myroides marinus]
MQLIRYLTLYILALMPLGSLGQYNKKSPDYYVRINLISATGSGYSVLLDENLEGYLSIHYFDADNKTLLKTYHTFKLDLKEDKRLFARCVERLSQRPTIKNPNYHRPWDATNYLLFINGERKMDNYTSWPKEFEIIYHLLEKHAYIKLDYNIEYTLKDKKH